MFVFWETPAKAWNNLKKDVWNAFEVKTSQTLITHYVLFLFHGINFLLPRDERKIHRDVFISREPIRVSSDLPGSLSRSFHYPKSRDKTSNSISWWNGNLVCERDICHFEGEILCHEVINMTGSRQLKNEYISKANPVSEANPALISSYKIDYTSITTSFPIINNMGWGDEAKINHGKQIVIAEG